MLQSLHIQNFALIDDVTISLEDGFSVITGETGAGKSIMLDALGLLLGKRADVNALRDADRKCVIEANLNVSEYGLQAFFEEHDLDYEASTIVRREIGKNGKSRAFVNDSPVVLSVLKSLGTFMIDVHSQNANSLISSGWFSYDLVDGYAGIIEKRVDYKKDYQHYIKKVKELEELKNKLAQSEQELSFKQFQLNELEEAQLKEGEQEELEREVDVLSNAEGIREKLQDASTQLQYSNGSILERLNSVSSIFEGLSNLSPDFLALYERIDSVKIELEDLKVELEGVQRNIEINPSRLQEVDNRLSMLFSLLKKFSVVDANGLLERKLELEKEVQEVVGGGEVIEKMEKEVEKKRGELQKKAKQISSKRKAVVKQLEQEVMFDLTSMNMENSILKVEITNVELNSYGYDEIALLFNANKGGVLQSLSKIASGGEFSRIMLSLKKILSSKKNLPTILFDEIDTGVSGEVAAKMALIMEEMSQKMQVIAITHLPQIASKGKVHFKVYKSDVNEVTQSQIEQLNTNERVEELAKMLSGSKVTEAAVSNAKELLGVC